MRKSQRPALPFRIFLHQRAAFVCAAGLLTLALCAGWGATSWAQSSSGHRRPEKPYALIYGTVWAPDGVPVYGVLVKIRRADQKKPRWELYSDHRGEFAQRVPPGPGDYIVWADLKGFKFEKGKELHPGPEVAVHIDNEERADIGLHLK